MTAITLADQLLQHNLTPPQANHEDWCYYDVSRVLATPLTQAVAKPHREVEPNTLYFFNDTCVWGALDPAITVTKQAAPPIASTQNPFVQLKKDVTIQLECQQFNGDITLIYEADGYQSSDVTLTGTDSTVRVHRRFINTQKSLQNNQLACHLTPGTSVTIVDTNAQNKGAILDFMDVYVSQNAVFKAINTAVLCANARFQSRVYLNQETAQATLHGLSINGCGDQSFYNTHVHHNAPNTQSRQLFKSLNKNDSVFEYNGKVSVAPKAQQIDSYQLNQNIILDEYAAVHSRPQLFIEADDVQCSHGSTTGDIPSDALFYLNSRGLNPLVSRSLLLKAFIQDVLTFAGDDTAAIMDGLDHII